MAITYYSHSHGQYLSISSRVGGDDDSGTSASHTTSLFKSIFGSNPSGSPMTSGQGKPFMSTTTWSLEAKSYPPHIQLPNRGRAHVFDGEPKQQISHNPPIRPTSNSGCKRHIVPKKGGIATAIQDLFRPFDCATAIVIALSTREDVSIHLLDLTSEPAPSSSVTIHEDCNLEF